MFNSFHLSLFFLRCLLPTSKGSSSLSTLLSSLSIQYIFLSIILCFYPTYLSMLLSNESFYAFFLAILSKFLSNLSYYGYFLSIFLWLFSIQLSMVIFYPSFYGYFLSIFLCSFPIYRSFFYKN